MRHWHRDPAPSTRRFVANAPVTPTAKGLQLAIELIAYPEGKVQVAVSRISGAPGHRTIVQAESLMFNDINEAKDAIDGLADRLDQEAGAAQWLGRPCPCRPYTVGRLTAKTIEEPEEIGRLDLVPRQP